MQFDCIKKTRKNSYVPTFSEPSPQRMKIKELIKIIVTFLDSHVSKLKYGVCDQLMKETEKLESELEIKILNEIQRHDQEHENEEQVDDGQHYEACAQLQDIKR